MSDQSQFTVSETGVGLRADKFLSLNLTGCSLRKARRLLKTGNCLVNGKKIPIHCKLKNGDVLIVQETDLQTLEDLPIKIQEDDHYIFYYKPPDMHTADIPGSSSPNFERWLRTRKDGNGMILQRLDYGTNGIITVAKSKESAEEFRLAEKTGKCQKFYLCLLENRFSPPFAATSPLQTDNRRKTGVLNGTAEQNRCTLFYPFPSFHAPGNLVWCIAVIERGQRHQIRAHAAACGHPLSGDSFYGGKGKSYFLWNFVLKFPGYKIVSPQPKNISLPPFQSLLEIAYESLNGSEWENSS